MSIGLWLTGQVGELERSIVELFTEAWEQRGGSEILKSDPGEGSSGGGCGSNESRRGDKNVNSEC